MEAYRATFRDRLNGDEFRLRFEWHQAEGVRRGGYFRIYVERMPACRFPLGMAAHLLDEDEVCVLRGREPRTLERAKAIGMFWLRGFGMYRRTEVFPNEGGTINVVEC